MDPFVQVPDMHRLAHLEEARRVLSLPLEANGLHWHPFGVFGVPLAKRFAEDEVWVRRLHVWHPDTDPVGESSLYGVHTHSGTASSHVLVGALTHHLYAYRPDPDGNWLEANRDGRRHASLVAHVAGDTVAGVTHTFPAHHPHGVSKPPGFAISLFEQREEGRSQPFTTWQRLDVPEEALVGSAPVDPRMVLREARALLEETMYALA